MTILRPNLVFGGPSHFVHLMTQIVMKGRSPNTLGTGHHNFLYAPVHSDDVAAATEQALTHAHGQSYSLNGPEQLTLG